MRKVIWPQAFKRMIPPLGNQFIISIKDTSLLSVILVPELLFQAALDRIEPLQHRRDLHDRRDLLLGGHPLIVDRAEGY